MQKCSGIRDFWKRSLVAASSIKEIIGWAECSCAFSVNNFDTVLLIFFTGDPVGFEGGEGAEGWSTLPDGVVSISGGKNLNHVWLWAHLIDFFLHSFWETGIHGSTTREHDGGVQVLSDIDVTLLDGLECHFVEAFDGITYFDQIWEEQSFWAHESWWVNNDNLTIGKFVVHVMLSAVSCFVLVCCWVLGDETSFFLDLSDNLLPSSFTTLGLDTISD